MTLACSVNDLFAWRFQRDASGARVKDASLFPEESVEKTRLPLTVYQLHGDGLFWSSVFQEESIQKTNLLLTIHQLHGDGLFWC